nr:hypothetical protein CR513_28042 [Ipomoea batatas]
MSRGLSESGRGKIPARSGKFSIAELPFMLSAATSCARAAISGVGKVPSQMRDFFLGSLISDTHFPQLRILTPRYTGCLLLSLILFIFLLSGPETLPPPPQYDSVLIISTTHADEISGLLPLVLLPPLVSEFRFFLPIQLCASTSSPPACASPQLRQSPSRLHLAGRSPPRRRQTKSRVVCSLVVWVQPFLFLSVVVVAVAGD